jgi:hypothetical protein
VQSPEVVRTRLADVQRRIGESVTIVAATKYVPLRDMATPEAGAVPWSARTVPRT